MAGPLAGVRILEFSEIIAGPFGGMLLSDMGADVIKVEPPWGEPWRLSVQFIPFESRTYMGLNRGKKSLPLDLTKGEAREIVYRLVPEMDVVIVNYRPDVPAKLGIDYETLSAINPRIIYCENTAFGKVGPQAHRGGYDIVVQSVTGLMAAEGKSKDGVPQQITSTAIADYATGLSIAWGVSAALYAREKTGRGQKVDTTLLGSALAVQGGRFMSVEAIDAEWRAKFQETLAECRAKGKTFDETLEALDRVRPMRPPGNIYYRSFLTKDGIITIGNLSDTLRKKTAAVLGLNDPRFEPGYDRTSPEAIAAGERLVHEAEAIFRTRTTQEWLETFDKAGVPAGPFQFVEELMDDPQVLANDLVVEVEHPLAGPVKMVAPFVKMTETPLEAQGASPALGEHTDQVLRGIGYDEETIARLKQDGVTR